MISLTSYLSLSASSRAMALALWFLPVAAGAQVTGNDHMPTSGGAVDIGKDLRRMGVEQCEGLGKTVLRQIGEQGETEYQTPDKELQLSRGGLAEENAHP